MKLADYQQIINHVEGLDCRCSRIVLNDVLEKFLSLGSHDTLFSIFLNYIQKKVRVTFSSKTKSESTKYYYQLYKDMVNDKLSADKQSHVLVHLSNRFEIPPSLMARIIIEQFLQDQSDSEGNESIKAQDPDTRISVGHQLSNTRAAANNLQLSRLIPIPSKQAISSWLKDPYLITDAILREQVLQCISYDVCYGPINDAIRHSVGLEFELKLRDFVNSLKLPFLDENDLRKRGYDKTPDIKLEVPIVVQGQPVCWIESKASFGDLETHNEYLRGQYLSYWNRFGPGLVIYWFGFIDQIFEDMKKQGMLTMDRFPRTDEITFMSP